MLAIKGITRKVQLVLLFLLIAQGLPIAREYAQTAFPHLIKTQQLSNAFVILPNGTIKLTRLILVVEIALLLAQIAQMQHFVGDVSLVTFKIELLELALATQQVLIIKV